MSTLSFHADPTLERRIKSEAKKRKMPVSRFIKETVSQSLEAKPKTGADIEGILKGTGSGTIDPEDHVLEPWSDDFSLFERK